MFDSFLWDTKWSTYEFKLRKHWQKAETTDLKKNYHAETCTSADVKMEKNRRKQNFEDEANNMQLDKENTQRSNLNSKYPSATLVV